MHFAHKLILSVLLTALLGCTTLNNQNLQKDTELLLSQKVIAGKTTKDEIQALFSSPTFATFDAGGEVWKYEVSENNPQIDTHKNSVDWHGTPINNAPVFQSTRAIKKQLVILFDEKGVVKNYSYSNLPSF
jgi:hypothetical protein